MAIQRRNAACSIYIKGALTGDELFEKHGARHLAQYESQLRLMREAVENGEVPDGTDQSVRPYVEQLKRHLGIDDIAEHDDFLLRFALIVPGRMRGIRPPLVVLTPERGGFSHQRLEQAATQFTRLRMALHLGRRFDGNLSSDTYTALRELADRIEGLAEIDGGWVEIHENLSSIEADRLAQHAIACLDAPLKDEQELGIEVLNCLANFRHDGLKGRTADLLRRGIFWPASLYRDAPDNIAAALVQQIAKADGMKLNHLLLALAWTRGEPARRMFLEWRIQPPAWTASLHVPPEDYLPNAGWALDSNGGGEK
jgi:hypothetical protein